PSLVRVVPDAAQTQRRSPSPHPEDVVQGTELAGLRGGPAGAGQLDVGDRGRSVGMLADHWAGRAGSVFRRSRPDQPDAAHGVQAGVAADRGPDDVGADVDGPDDHSTISRRTAALPVIQPASVPHGPLHVLIDSTGPQVYGAGQWLEAKHGAK